MHHSEYKTQCQITTMPYAQTGSTTPTHPNNINVVLAKKKILIFIAQYHEVAQYHKMKNNT